MPAEVFVDTGVWYAAANPRVAEHDRSAAALRRMTREGARAVSTNLVIAETHVLLLRRVNRAVALAFAQTVRRVPNLIVTSTPELEERAIADWLAGYEDQDFSLTDAVSFAVMRDRGIEVALTLDHHFAVAGFRVLPSATA